MQKLCRYKPHLMVGDQSYPAYELRNLLGYLKKCFGTTACEKLCGEIGIGEHELAHSQFVYVWQVDYAMTLLQQISQDPEVGAKAASDYQLSDLGFLLPLMAECQTLGECFEFVISHPELVGSFSDTLVSNEDGLLKVRWLNTNKLEVDKYSCQFQHSIASLMTFASELTGKQVNVAQIALAESIRTADFLASCTGAKICFNAEFFEWSIAEELLNLPVTFPAVAANTTMALDGTRSYISAVLQDLRASAPDLPSMDALALAQNISTRTLRRRLSNAGTSYQKLLRQVRCQMAIDLILSNQHSIETISDLMGFGDVSHFRQSFKHWIGHPPGHFHRLNRGKDAASSSLAEPASIIGL